MINNRYEFTTSYKLLHTLTSDSPPQDDISEPITRRTVIAALKVLNQAAIEGTSEEKALLYKSWDNIVALNTLLSSGTFASKVKSKLHVEMSDRAEFEGMQIALPQTKFEKMVEVVTKIPRAVLATLIDVTLLAPAAILVLVAMCGVKFDPSHIKKNQIPILLIHGNGFNETEWLLGRQYLKKEQYGSVFSLNYDGLVTNDSKMGIDDYAKGKIRDKIEEIKRLTGHNEVILIGHSMGGMIASQYAEKHASRDGTIVNHVMSIATPWKGSPLLNVCPKFIKTKRYKQMSPSNSWRRKLVDRALTSERIGRRKYYHINSSMDFMAPSPYSALSEDPRRQYTHSYLGHYGIIGSPQTWGQVCKWLDHAYTTNRSS